MAYPEQQFMKRQRTIITNALALPGLMALMLGTGCAQRLSIVAINSGFVPKVDNSFPSPVAGVGVLRVQLPFSIDSIDGKPGPKNNGEFGLYDISLLPGSHVLSFLNGEHAGLLDAHQELNLNIEAGCVYKLANFVDRGRSRAIVLKNGE